MIMTGTAETTMTNALPMRTTTATARHQRWCSDTPPAAHFAAAVVVLLLLVVIGALAIVWLRVATPGQTSSRRDVGGCDPAQVISWNGWKEAESCQRLSM